MAIKGSAVNIWVRKRGHACFRVDKPVDAAQRVAPLFTQGDDDYVIIRADVVTGCDFNLIVAIDAAESEWPTAVRLVEQAVGQSTAAVCVVTATFPEIPQQAHCFITEDEHRRYPLHEYSPPGRHPKSPGANPWG
jgi:hypothetical protein